MLTETQKRALKIVQATDGIRPELFARQLWPTHEGWRRVGKCGQKGSRRGVGLILAGGAYLGKLQRLGYVERWHDKGWHITARGVEVLM